VDVAAQGFLEQAQDLVFGMRRRNRINGLAEVGREVECEPRFGLCLQPRQRRQECREPVGRPGSDQVMKEVSQDIGPLFWGESAEALAEITLRQ